MWNTTELLASLGVIAGTNRLTLADQVLAQPPSQSAVDLFTGQFQLSPGAQQQDQLRAELTQLISEMPVITGQQTESWLLEFALPRADLNVSFGNGGILVEQVGPPPVPQPHTLPWTGPEEGRFNVHVVVQPDALVVSQHSRIDRHMVMKFSDPTTLMVSNRISGDRFPRPIFYELRYDKVA